MCCADCGNLEVESSELSLRQQGIHEDIRFKRCQTRDILQQSSTRWEIELSKTHYIQPVVHMNASSQLSRRLYFIVSFVIDAWDVMSESMILRRYMSVSLFIYLLIRKQEKPYSCQHLGTSCMHEVISIWRLGLCTWLLSLLCLCDFHS